MFRQSLATIAALCLLSLNAHADVFEDLDACKSSCSQDCATLTYQLSAKLNDYKRSCGDPAPPNTPGGVQIYRSDTCSGNLVASVSPATNCGNLEQTGANAWGVKINNVCYDIQDTSVAQACAAFSGGASREMVEVYHSDTCGGPLLAALSPKTDCRFLSNLGNDAWAIKIGGKCQDITDTSLQGACAKFANANSGAAVKIYHSDTCYASSLIAITNAHTDCNSLPAIGTDAWGVEINGKCQDITDTSVRAACENFKGALAK